MGWNTVWRMCLTFSAHYIFYWVLLTFFFSNWNYIIHSINICIAVKDQQQPQILLVGKNYNSSRLQHKNNFAACEHNQS